MEKEIVYIIWSEEHRGWWRAGHRGYTEKREEAGHYEFEEAQHIVIRANINERDVPNEAIVPIEVCADCHETGEVSMDEDDGEGHTMRGVGTRPCPCRAKLEPEHEPE